MPQHTKPSRLKSLVVPLQRRGSDTPPPPPREVSGWRVIALVLFAMLLALIAAIVSWGRTGMLDSLLHGGS